MVGKPDLDFDPSAFIRSSWGLHDINQAVAGVSAALVDELAEQAGMAGDDDAGSAFGRLYDSAAGATIDAIAHATNLIGGGSRTTFQAALTFMAKDAELASGLRAEGLIGADGATAPQQVPQCDESPLGQASGLPGIRGDTSTVDRWVWGDRFRGSPDKLRIVAGTWRKAQRITTRVLSEVQDCWDLVKPAHGRTADATDRFFSQLCGYGPCLARVDDQEPLLANLPAACGQLAKACDNYADHLSTAKSRIPEDSLIDGLTNPLKGLFDNPVTGGNGEDGGLYDANAADPDITGLAAIPHALDHSRARVPVPHPGDNTPWWEKPLIPLPPLPGLTGPRQPGSPDAPEIPVTPEFPEIPFVPLVPVSYTPPDENIPYQPPIDPPAPPEPGFPPLTPGQRKSFEKWAAEQEASDFASGPPDDPANVYQYQVSGYPERVIPIEDGDGDRVGADGLRYTDGMVVEAKYVKEPDKCKSPRTLDNYAKNLPWHAGTHDGDEVEMDKYREAMAYPGNDGQIRGVEVVTNTQDSADYWNALMDAQGVHGYARLWPPPAPADAA